MTPPDLEKGLLGWVWFCSTDSVPHRSLRSRTEHHLSIILIHEALRIFNEAPRKRNYPHAVNGAHAWFETAFPTSCFDLALTPTPCLGGPLVAWERSEAIAQPDADFG